MLTFESNASLCFSYHTIQIVSVLFVVLFETCDPAAVMTYSSNAFPDYANKCLLHRLS